MHVVELVRKEELLDFELLIASIWLPTRTLLSCTVGSTIKQDGMYVDKNSCAALDKVLYFFYIIVHFSLILLFLDQICTMLSPIEHFGGLCW